MNINDSEHILSNLKKENLNLDPFPYFNFNSFFSKTYYEDLIRMKPLDEQFEKTDPNRTVNQYSINYRRRFNLAQKLDFLDKERKNFWQNFIQFFVSPIFVEHLLLMCKEPILKRYKINNLNDLKIYIRMELIRDTGGYMILPHTDSPKKIITMLMYIPNDDNNIDLGTSLFSPKDKNFESETTKQFDFKYFDEIKKMPYKKNFAFGFVKNKKSFHGRYPIDKKFTGKRDWINFSLQHRSGSL